MTDVMSKNQRRKNMQAIKSVSKMEALISSELWKKGYRFRRNSRGLFGKPDFSIKKYKLVIFIDSCFWHSCPIHGSMPKSNTDFWRKKLERNKQRDEEVNSYYKENNWNTLRVWEHEIKADFELVIEKLIQFTNRCKEKH